MSRHLLPIIDFFIPRQIQEEEHDLLKARSMVSVILLLAIVGLVRKISEMVAPPDVTNVINSGVILAFIGLIAFKKTGNFFITGNLIAFLCALIIGHIIIQNGGIHSREISWFIICPMITIYFVGWRSGFVWFIAALGFIVGLYVFNDYISINRPYANNLFDSFFSSFFLFIIFFSLMAIFMSVKNLSIRTLKEKNRELENQKSLLEKHQAMLVEQKAILEYQNQQIELKNNILTAVEEKLRQTNQELESFAYAASHDLKEPLRMIGMYTQLTQKRLQQHLDEPTTEYMRYVTDGVNRMQKMLNDLLQYSRLGKQKDDIKDVDLNDTLYLVVHNLMASMKDTNAAIQANPLPIVRASNVEMQQLLQNLISNAIKFRKSDVAPVIEIRVSESPNEYIISLRDNGIGIKTEYQERVFNIFERLHSRGEYEGSGIGLATCKKIVNSSGGRIWLSSTEGIGTTFFFTLPKAA